jgi:hypothetical protein
VRFLVIIIIWVSLIGGLFLWLNLTAPLFNAIVIVDDIATGKFDLEITTTFTGKPDPFALQLDDNDKASALTVLLKGTPIFIATDNVTGGIPIVTKDIDNIIVGKNEFYIEATIPLALASQVHAIRLRITRDGFEVAQKSFWTIPGVKLQTSFILDIEADQRQEDDHHDH